MMRCKEPYSIATVDPPFTAPSVILGLSASYSTISCATIIAKADVLPSGSNYPRPSTMPNRRDLNDYWLLCEGSFGGDRLLSRCFGGMTSLLANYIFKVMPISRLGSRIARLQVLLHDIQVEIPAHSFCMCTQACERWRSS